MVSLALKPEVADAFFMHLPKTRTLPTRLSPELRPETKGPSGNHDKEGQATVASFRTWRGLPAFNPWPLTESSKLAGPNTRSKMKSAEFSLKPLAR